MKTKSQNRPDLAKGARFGRARDNFTREQLAEIGAVAMTYNDVEAGLHRLFGNAVKFRGSYYEISTRINGTEGLIAIIKHVAEKSKFPDEDLRTLDFTLSSFTEIKSHRNAIVHSVIRSTALGTGVMRGSRNQFTIVLLTVKALSGVVDRLEQIKSELDLFHKIFSCRHRLTYGEVSDDGHRERMLQAIQDANSEVLQYQNHRRSLPPLPTLPDAPDVWGLELPE